MTRTQIIEIAESTGAILLEGFTVDMLIKFATKVAEQEREHCARLAEIAEPYCAADLIRKRK